MSRDNLSDLVAFITVAKEKSFTRAAAQLGISQSALSHSMRALEARLGVRLLTRTTRSVSPTEIGERLLTNLTPHFDEIYAELADVSEMKDKPAGTVRITATDYAIRYIIWPKLAKLLKDYPDIRVELSDDYALTDIAADRFDAGVRLGSQVSAGMISVRISPDMRFAVVGSPDYFRRYGIPRAPQDLLKHQCINLRLPTHGGIYAWEFESEGKPVRVKVDGQFIFNDVFQIRDACRDGYGLAYMPEEMAADDIANGRLIRVLDDASPWWDGHHIYYPDRRQSSRALSLIIDALRYQP